MYNIVSLLGMYFHMYSRLRHTCSLQRCWWLYYANARALLLLQALQAWLLNLRAIVFLPDIVHLCMLTRFCNCHLEQYGRSCKHCYLRCSKQAAVDILNQTPCAKPNPWHAVTVHVSTCQDQPCSVVKAARQNLPMFNCPAVAVQRHFSKLFRIFWMWSKHVKESAQRIALT